jgi:hypothetical protein
MGGEVTQVLQSQHQPEEIPGEVDDEDEDDEDDVAGMGDIYTMKIEPGSVTTLRYTVSQDCQIRWKFKSEGGDLAFGVQRKEAVMNREGTEFVEDSSATSLDFITSTRVFRFVNLYFFDIYAIAGSKSQRTPGWGIAVPGRVHLLT